MKYGKNDVTRKLKKTSAKSEKITNKLLLYCIKLALVMVAFVFVLGVSLGYGVFKGIIDSAPEINVASIEPSGFATMVYDSEGNLLYQNDDYSSLNSRITYTLEAGKTYTVKVTRHNGGHIYGEECIVVFVRGDA